MMQCNLVDMCAHEFMCTFIHVFVVDMCAHLFITPTVIFYSTSSTGSICTHVYSYT